MIRALLVALLLAIAPLAQAATGVRFEVSYPASLEQGPLDGRVLLVIAKTNEREPRFQVGRGLRSQPLFGIDVDGWRAGQPAVIDAATRGWPLESTSEIPAGEYWVQAVFNVYTTFRRADGHVIKAHMDQWEGQKWNLSPGNLISEVVKLRVDPESTAPVKISLARKIPAIDPPKDTKYVKHVKFKSEILTRWWGRDIFLGAIVVLPEGFEDRPNARYPVAYLHGHFQRSWSAFRESPPGPELVGREKEQAEGQYRLFQDWVSGKLGRS